jgi:hypothetical protein
MRRSQEQRKKSPALPGFFMGAVCGHLGIYTVLTE